MANLFRESFEATGYDLGEYPTVSTGWHPTNADPDATDITPPANGGVQCLKLVMSASAASVYRFIGASDVPITYTTFYVYIDSQGLATNSNAYLGRGFISSWGTNAWDLKLYRDASDILKFQCAVYTGGARYAIDSAAISTGTWYRIRVKYDATNALYSFSYTPTGGSETTVISGSLTATYQAGYNNVFLGSTDNVTYTAHFDRVMVDSLGFDVDPSSTVPTFRSGRTIYSASANTLTCVKPPDTMNGDVMLALAYQNTTTSAITPPSGWNLLNSVTTGITGIISLYYKIAASEGADYVWGFPITDRCRVSIAAYSGASATINAYDGQGDASSYYITAPTITPTLDNCLIVLCGGTDTTSNMAPLNPTGGPPYYVEDYESTDPSIHDFQSLTQTTATATGEGQIVMTSQSTTGGFHVALSPYIATLIKTINGLARASIKTVNGLPWASVKSLNGLA